MRIKDFVDKYKGVLVQTGVGIAKCYAAKKLSEYAGGNIASTALLISGFSDYIFSGFRFMINSCAEEINYKEKNMKHFFMNPQLPTFTEKIIVYDTPKAIKQSLEQKVTN